MVPLIILQCSNHELREREHIRYTSGLSRSYTDLSVPYQFELENKKIITLYVSLDNKVIGYCEGNGSNEGICHEVHYFKPHDQFHLIKWI